MPAKPQPKRQPGPDGKLMSWDMKEKPKEPKHKYNRLCRHCHVWLTTLAEERIGIHISCVQSLNVRHARLAPIMKRPNYGSSHDH